MTSTFTGSDAAILDAASAGLEYEVFLSFRGLDTRNNFTDHLYVRLVDAGIRVYRDNEELPVGEVIGPELLKAIKQSKIAIPILSKGYAFSKWCLYELVQIMECKRHGNLKVMPIFYDVSPSEIRNQTGSWKQAFNLHGNCYDDETVRDWRRALRGVGELKGWDLQNDTNKQEGTLVKEITKMVLRELKKVHLFVTEYLVGLEDHVEEILSMIGAERSGVGVFGIHGMGGIGKTTLAKSIYNQLLPRFQSHSFVADIRETFQTKGIQFLQKKFISDILSKEAADNIDTDEGFLTISQRFSGRKVLILLDDVDNNFEIQGLMGKREWFASGSTIIVTTRHKGILDMIQADWSYELCGMHPHHALQLFNKHAFRNDKPLEDYAELSEKAVEICGGLPLSLEVTGSLLCGKSKEVWEHTLKKLKKAPHKDVSGKLKISFEVLDEQQKQICLDIACFFIGVDHRMAICYWHGSELYPEEAIEVLQQASLIKIGADNLLWMHDQMRDFCRDYVGRGHVGESEKQLILWNQEEATRIFMKKMGGENVQGLFLELSRQSQWFYIAENFAKLPYLKFLQVKDHVITHDFGEGLGTIAGLCSLLKRSPPAPSELRWLSWHHYSPMYELDNLSFRNLVFLDLSESSIGDGWELRSQFKIAEKLKVLNLSGCQKLTKTPDFSRHLLLEQLIMERCLSLIEIDESIRMLKRLLIINLRGCRRLHKLPEEVGGVESLVELILDGTSVAQLPNCLKYEEYNLLDHGLHFRGILGWLWFQTDIRGLPESIRDLVHLSLLSLKDCRYIMGLPESIGGLVSLIELDLSYSGIVDLPDSIGNMKNLKILNLDGCGIRELPTSLGKLERLEVFSADGCHHLESISNLPHRLVSLTVRSNERRMKRIPDFSNLTCLKHLIAYFIDVPCYPPEMEILCNIGTSSKLIELKLSFPHIHILQLQGSLGELSHLKEMVLEKCRRLRSIPKLPSSLTMLRVDDCGLLKSLPDLSHLRNLRELHIGHSPIQKVKGLQTLEHLRKLVLDGCGIQRLPDMSNLKKLKVLEVEGCPDLVEIQGRLLDFLEVLRVFNCESLEKIPDIPNMDTMKIFFVAKCEKLQSISSDTDPNCGDVEENTFTPIPRELLETSGDPIRINRMEAADIYPISFKSRLLLMLQVLLCLLLNISLCAERNEVIRRIRVGYFIFFFFVSFFDFANRHSGSIIALLWLVLSISLHDARKNGKRAKGICCPLSSW